MKDEGPYSDMAWIYRISQDEYQKEIKTNKQLEILNVRSCNDSSRSNLGF